MTTWEIRIVDQAPLRVVVAEGRNLKKEFELFCENLRQQAENKSPKWKFWAKPDLPVNPYWEINTETTVHVSTVTAVLICKRVRRQSIGFTS